MRVLIASFYQPGTGGYWNYIYQLQQGLQLAGHEVEIFCRHPKTAQYCLLTVGKRIERCGIRSFVKEKSLPYFLQMNAAGSKITELEMDKYSLELAAAYMGLSNYDLIHAQDVISARALSRVKPQGLPLVTTIHGVYSEDLLRAFPELINDPAYVRYGPMLEQWGVLSSWLVIVPSHAMKDWFCSHFQLSADKFRVVKHGMEIATFFQKMDWLCELERPKGKKVLVCVSRLSEEKGHVVLMGALHRLKQVRNDWVCWVIGNGPMMSTLQQICRESDLDQHVLFLGDRNDVPAILKKADIFVMASFQESLSYAIMEAQLAGKPVTATQVGGIPEIIEHEVTGLLFKSGDMDALCNNLIRLLADEGLAKTLGARARSEAEKGYSLQDMVNKTLTIYEEVCHGNGYRS